MIKIGLAIAAIAAVTSVMPAYAAEGTQSWLNATAGQGQGRVLVASTAQEHGEFYAQGEVEVEGAPADTQMIVTRALYTPGCASITVQWGPVTTLQTSPGGAGAAHFVRAAVRHHVLRHLPGHRRRHRARERLHHGVRQVRTNSGWGSCVRLPCRPQPEGGIGWSRPGGGSNPRSQPRRARAGRPFTAGGNW